MNSNKIDKAYISEHDLMFHEFDKNNPIKSSSQQREIEKHARIASLRDGQSTPKASFVRKFLRVFFSGSLNTHES